jgi:hypothetical protein
MPSPLDSVSEDSLAHVLCYLDFRSAVRWKQTVAKKWGERLSSTESGSMPHVWRRFFHRQAFSSEDLGEGEGQGADFYIQKCRYRRKLQQTLFGRTRLPRKIASRQSRPQPPLKCFHLPNRLLSFLPVVPDGGEDESWWQHVDDLPIVNFSCDSFLLISTAVGGEILLLNPFSRSLSLYQSVLDNAVHSDEGMMEQAIHEAASLIAQKQSRRQREEPDIAMSAVFQKQVSGESIATDDKEEASGREEYPLTTTRVIPSDEEELEIAATAIEDRLHRNHHMHRTHNRVTPKHTLISWQEDMLDYDLMDYFGQHAPHHRPLVENGDDGVEVEVDYMGIDAKPVLHENGVFTGTTMMAVGRAMCSEVGQGLECFEAVTWFRDTKSNLSRHVCRVRGDYELVELCACRRRVYVSPSHRNDEQNSDYPRGASKIYVYPMVEYQGNERSTAVAAEDDKPSKYFPNPTLVVDCKNRVSAIALCATGSHLIVSTEAGNLLFWQMGKSSFSLEKEVTLERALEDAVGELAISQVAIEAAKTPIGSILCPRAVSIETCGFCTLHRGLTHGTTVLLWHKTTSDDDGEREWRLQSMIYLPLSAQRTPQVHYDGNRLIVFGQDHISLLILVYEVSSTLEHLAANTDCLKTKGQLDGGVFDLSSKSRVRFANRIRHAALGGIEDFESLRMTCNERFIVVNTKTGNLLSGGSVPFQEGLLVIDLEDHCYC